jgi:hypothetical protein
MDSRAARFLPPLVVSIVGFFVAVYFINMLLGRVAWVIGADGINYDMTRILPGGLGEEVQTLLLILMPLLIVEYLLLGIPIAGFLLVITLLIRSLKYEVVILELGEEFGLVRILKRAMIPALFSFSLGGIISGLLRGAIFNPVPEIGDELLAFLYQPMATIFVTLLALPIALALYNSTWLLNDAGVVTQLKQSELQARRCPDTIGIGRWWSNLLGGFTLLITPVMSFYYYFYLPVFEYGLQLNTFVVLMGLFLSLGLPFVTFAFVLPVVIVNEIVVKKTTPIIQRIARYFGAKFATPEAEMEALI